MIGVWASPDCLLTGYDYGIKVCLAVLVMDSVISTDAVFTVIAFNFLLLTSHDCGILHMM